MTTMAFVLAAGAGVAVGLWLRGLFDTWKRNRQVAAEHEEWIRSRQAPQPFMPHRQMTGEEGQGRTARQSRVHISRYPATRIETDR